ncbi:hypothetical protein [Lyngbya aestuarii]|uniref:hypothetical protein n=1 Tax=Lyngbya aestuarii TaxID=118322 RepID=UPI00403DC57A
MNFKQITQSEQQQEKPGKRAQFWEKYIAPPLELVMGNPKLTPIFLLILGVAPFLITALILALVFLSPEVK